MIAIVAIPKAYLLYPGNGSVAAAADYGNDSDSGNNGDNGNDSSNVNSDNTMKVIMAFQ